METFRSAASRPGKGTDIDPAGTGGWEGFSTGAGHASRPEGAVEEAEAAGQPPSAPHEPRTSVGGTGDAGPAGAGNTNAGSAGGDDGAEAAATGGGANASSLGGHPEPRPSEDLAAPAHDAPRAAAPGIGSTSAVVSRDANSSDGAGSGASGAGSAGTILRGEGDQAATITDPASVGGAGVPSGSGAAAQPSPQGNEPSSGKGMGDGSEPPVLPGIAPTAIGGQGPSSIDGNLGQDGSVPPANHR
ncbi:hypothetical protein [Derxia gummosa]|uniref:Uncharacterized protein n=1 Tax=Derxia gummosa DSM 723 TaxID=1121388 RepID=A0A8B6X9H4_9BURK|nr:hypothetical protein [Derxia gummosa]